jgi:hypothetical protein
MTLPNRKMVEFQCQAALDKPGRLRDSRLPLLGLTDGRWAIGSAQYEWSFATAKIDPEFFPDLTDADLEKLGVPLGHHKWPLQSDLKSDLASASDAAPAHRLCPRSLDAEAGRAGPRGDAVPRHAGAARAFGRRFRQEKLSAAEARRVNCRWSRGPAATLTV